MRSRDAAEPPPPPINVDTDRYFQAIVERRISDAEKELDTIRTTLPATETARGYLKALEGLLLTTKSNDDRYLYLARIEKTPKKLKQLRKDFATHAKSRLHADYDRGYFQALESYVRQLERLQPVEVAANMGKKEDKKS